MVDPFIIGTRNTKEFLSIGVNILRGGGSSIDAVEATINAVEENPKDHSVGLGGIPNLLGEVQLDASIMDGKTLRSGAVAAVKGYIRAISLARKVMELTPHVMLVGEGAEMLADALGFERSDLMTDKSQRLYDLFRKDAIEGIENERRREYIRRYVEDYNLREWYDRLSGEHHGTVNVLAMDANGDVCSGVSTSGLSLKFPGRVGDSPIIGAGNYCDNMVGAAACTGRGELAIRCSTAHTIIMGMRQGLSLEESCICAMRSVNGLNETGGINCLAFDVTGNTMCASTRREPIHYYMDLDTHEPEEREGVFVKD
ncbi:MAG: isoaspartyl peptidase/L-asparaginase [Candidatus Bathyarchaeia archaeon]